MSGRLTTLKIVVYQSNPADTALIQDTLKRVGAEAVTCFSDIKATAQYLRGNTVGLVIADLDSSPVDGAAFAKMMRSEKMPANNDTPLLLTARPDDQARLKDAAAAGANGIALKPLSQEVLIKAIGGCLKKDAA